MSCAEVQAGLIQRDPLPGAAATHIAGCAACTAFARRREIASDLFRRHQAGFEPDPAFASRLAARLAAEHATAADPVAWAALRLLPLAVALALGLALLGAWPGPGSTAVAAAVTQSDEEPVLWIAGLAEIEESGETP